MDKKTHFASLLTAIEYGLLTSLPAGADPVKEICQFLKDNVVYYDWVGVYWVEGADDLVLGPYAGAETDHTRIKFGQGICGQAAEQLRNFVVQDVNAESNYLSCSIHVKSEIVLPLFKNEHLVGELDIDSHTLAPFSEEDERFLEAVGRMIVSYLA